MAGLSVTRKRFGRVGGVAALCALVTAVLAVAVALAPSRGAAGQGRGAVVRVLPLGDSITWGQGSPSGSGYRAGLWALVAGQSRYAVRFVGSQRAGDLPEPANEGHPGYTIGQVAAGVDRWMAAARPDVVLLHVGINDLRHGIDPAHAPDRLAALIDRIYTDRPRVSVVFMGLIPTTARHQQGAAAFNVRAAALQRAERRLGRSFWYVVPPALTRAQFADGLHPDDAGYARIAQAFFPALSAAAADRKAAEAPAG